MESIQRMASMRGSMRGSMRSMSRSASTWRTTSTAFGRSGREEDDEEALKWAVLEKLPTFDRMRKGILSGAGGPAQEVNIQDLGILERKNLLEKLVKTTTVIVWMNLFLKEPLLTLVSMIHTLEK